MELKKNSTRFIFRLVLLLLIVFVTPTFAQPGFDDDVNDEPIAAIDNSILVLTALGMSSGIYFLNERRKTKNI